MSPETSNPRVYCDENKKDEAINQVFSSKRNREYYSKLSESKIETLEKTFSKNKYPKKEQYEDLAKELQESVPKIENWFKHQRRKYLKESSCNTYKKRRLLSEKEKAILEETFRHEMKPDRRKLHEMAHQLKFTTKVISNWFSYRRKKFSKLANSKKNNTISEQSYNSNNQQRMNSNQPTNDTNQNETKNNNCNNNNNNKSSENSNDGVTEQQKMTLQNNVSMMNSQNFQKNEVMNNDFRLGMMMKNNGSNLYDPNMFKMNQNMNQNLVPTQNVGFAPIDYSQRMNNNNYQYYGQPLFILPSQDCLFIPIYKPQNNYFTVQQPMQGLYNPGFQACPNYPYPQNQQNYMGISNKKQGEN